VAVCYAALEQRRGRIAATRIHLNSSVRTVCAKPSTLLWSIAAGALLRLASSRTGRPEDPEPAEHAPFTGAILGALTEFGALALQQSARHLALRASEALVRESPASREANASETDSRPSPSREGQNGNAGTLPAR
jgi:hypothetical protein